MSIAKFPTLGQTVPIYNYLIDIIEEFVEKKDGDESQNYEDIINASNQAKEKLQQYYPTSDGLVYVIAISMYYIKLYLFAYK